MGHLRAAAATQGISDIADVVQLLPCPGRLGYQPKGEPPSDDRRRDIAQSSRLANRGDHLLSIHHTNASGSPLALAPSHPPLKSDPRPPLEVVVVHRQTVAASGEDEHSGADQLIADVSGCSSAYPLFAARQLRTAAT